MAEGVGKESRDVVVCFVDVPIRLKRQRRRMNGAKMRPDGKVNKDDYHYIARSWTGPPEPIGQDW